MSVINKMLRDLDQRNGTPNGASGKTSSSVHQGTASVSRDLLTNTSATRLGPNWAVLVGSLAVVAAASGGWLWWSAHPPGTAVEVVAASAPAALQSPAMPNLSASAAVTPPVGASEPAHSDATDVDSTASAAADTGGAAGAMNLRMESSLSARRALDALLSTPIPSAVQPATVAANSPPPQTGASATTAPTPKTTSAPADRTPSRPVVAQTTPLTAAGSNATGAPAIERQQQAGGDAIAQAQALWSSGAHDAAIDLMQQSIAAAERSVRAGTAPGSSTLVLVPLVREMARMQLAEARYGAVWEMLTRLEPLLGNQADLWAIRANAAQRLGRHPDSVHAYMMALQSRPDEQRWLLGTAVSLAALGQTSSAAEMAEKARAVGPVSKDILAYLRQSGVPLREQ